MKPGVNHTADTVEKMRRAHQVRLADQARRREWVQKIKAAKANRRQRADRSVGMTTNTRCAPRMRSCLGCGGEFKSEGPHNRLCPDCRRGPLIHE